MKKQIEEKKDYGFVFGLNKEKGQQIIAIGGNKFRLVQPGEEKEVDSPDIAEKILEYINQPSVNVGTW